MKEKLTAHAPTPKFVQIWGVLFILFSTFMVAQTASHPSGMLYASGAVTVNHNPVNRSVSVFAGDIVTTGANATATIIANGSQLVVPAHSTIRYGSTSSGNTGISANSEGGGGDDEREEHKCKGDECKKCKGDDKEHCMCKVSEDDNEDHGHGHGDGQSKNVAMATNGNNGDGGNGDDDVTCEHEN